MYIINVILLEILSKELCGTNISRYSSRAAANIGITRWLLIGCCLQRCILSYLYCQVRHNYKRTLIYTFVWAASCLAISQSLKRILAVYTMYSLRGRDRHVGLLSLLITLLRLTRPTELVKDLISLDSQRNIEGSIFSQALHAFCRYLNIYFWARHKQMRTFLIKGVSEARIHYRYSSAIVIAW